MKVVKKTQCANCAQTGGDTKKDNKTIYDYGTGRLIEEKS